MHCLSCFLLSLYVRQDARYSYCYFVTIFLISSVSKTDVFEGFSPHKPSMCLLLYSWSYAALLAARWRVVNTKILTVSSILGWLTGKYFQTFWTDVLPSSSGPIQSNNMQDVPIFIPYLMAGAQPPTSFFVFLRRYQTMRNFQYLWVFTYNLWHQPRFAPTQYNRHSMGTVTSLISLSVFVNCTRR